MAKASSRVPPFLPGSLAAALAPVSEPRMHYG